MVKDSDKIQFLALYERVFESDGTTVKNCTRYPCIDLMLFCSIIAPHELPKNEIPKRESNESETEFKKRVDSICYYGDLKNGFMNLERIRALYLEITEQTI